MTVNSSRTDLYSTPDTPASWVLLRYAAPNKLLSYYCTSVIVVKIFVAEVRQQYNMN